MVRFLTFFLLLFGFNSVANTASVGDYCEALPKAKCSILKIDYIIESARPYMSVTYCYGGIVRSKLFMTSTMDSLGSEVSDRAMLSQQKQELEKAKSDLKRLRSQLSGNGYSIHSDEDMDRFIKGGGYRSTHVRGANMNRPIERKFASLIDVYKRKKQLERSVASGQADVDNGVGLQVSCEKMHKTKTKRVFKK